MPNDVSNQTTTGCWLHHPFEPICPECGHFAWLHTPPECCATTPEDGVQRLPCGCRRSETWVLRWALAECQQDRDRFRRENSDLRTEKAIIWGRQA